MAIDEVGTSETAAAGPQAVPPEPTGSATPDTAAARSKTHWLVFFGLAASILVLDQLTKAWLVSTLDPGEVRQVLGDWLRLIYTQNSGALFGMFRDNAVLFGLVSLAVIALIIVYHRQVGTSLYLSIALGLLLGGALGNMTDRLTRGFVVDFVDMGMGDVRWYTFNTADAAISISIVMLIGAALFPRLAGLGERRSDG
jgi:signal peptidase II